MSNQASTEKKCFQCIVAEYYTEERTGEFHLLKRKSLKYANGNRRT